MKEEYIKPKFKIGDVVIVLFDCSKIKSSLGEKYFQCRINTAYFENEWKYQVEEGFFGGNVVIPEKKIIDCLS